MDNVMIILDYLLGFDYSVVFGIGLYVGIRLARGCIKQGIRMTQDIQTEYPHGSDEINKVLEKE